MAYKVKIEGNESFELAKECVNSVFLSTDIPIEMHVPMMPVLPWKSQERF